MKIFYYRNVRVQNMASFVSTSLHKCKLGAVPGKFLAIVGKDPSDSKSNRVHVDIIFWICLFHLRYIL